MMNLENGLSAWGEYGPIGVAIFLIILIIAPTMALMAWLVRYVVTRFDSMNDKVVSAVSGMTGAVNSLIDYIKHDDRSIKTTINHQWETLGEIREDIAALKDRRTGKRTSEEDRAATRGDK